MYQKYIKPIFDFSLSLIGLIILLPYFVLIAILIRLDSKGPALFKQERSGKDGKAFEVYKFRTMYVGAPKNKPTSDLYDPFEWITPIGKYLRKLSIDELPQIYNILKGDMSIIGPRPVVFAEAELLNERVKNGSSKIKPGLTGLAQINGRDELSDTEKAKLDSDYVNNISFWTDFKIFIGTIQYVFKSEGVKEGSDSDDDFDSDNGLDLNQNTDLSLDN